VASIRLDDGRYVQEQYAVETNLATRIRTHELYSEPQLDYAGWVLDHISWRGDERTVDVGCGAGAYVAAARARTRHYIAGDLSAGMLRGIDAPARVNLDAHDLPFPARSVDVLLANHMIYHLPDRDGAVAEFARILRPGGTLLAATNSDTNMEEMRQVVRQAAKRMGLAREIEPYTPLSFTLENGAELLRRHFAHVERSDLPAALVFPEAQPVLDYLGTSPEFYLGLLPQEIDAGQAWQLLRELIDERIARDGAFRVGKLSGVFRCWNG
jgi:SAM-dependent methyltransferase